MEKMILSETPRIEVFNEDCMNVMARYPEKHFDLAIVDPPYGININMNQGRRKNDIKKHKVKKWDSDAPSEEYFNTLINKTEKQIIWGANNFNLPPSNGWIVWDKDISGNVQFSKAELAYSNIKGAIGLVKIRAQTGNETYSEKIHPTQKPVALYKWLLKNYAKQGDLILDTHGGSGSILIACYEMGFDIVWTELDTDYYNAAIERFRKHIAQGSLFSANQQYGTQKEIE